MVDIREAFNKQQEARPRQEFPWLELKTSENGKTTTSFFPDKLGNEILASNRFIYVKTGDKLKSYRYDAKRGYWKVCVKTEIQALVTNELNKPKAWNANRMNNTVTYIFSMIPTVDEELLESKHTPSENNFNNGVYDLLTGKFSNHDPEKYFFSVHNFDLPKSPKEAPMTKKWFEESFRENTPAVMEFIGYIFHKTYRPFQKFMILLGNGENGKSTFFNWLVSAIGASEVSNVGLGALTNPKDRFSKSLLVGKSLNTFPDISKGILEDPSLLKGITGDDIQSVEAKGKDGRSAKLYAKLFFGANALPKFRDSSKGFDRRPLIVEMHTIPDFKTRFNLNQIYKEIPDFMLLCMFAYKAALDRDNLTITESMDKLRMEWQGENNPVQAFVSEECELNPERKFRKKWLYDRYRNFCDENGYMKLSSQSFCKELKDLYGLEVKRIRFKDGHKPDNTWGFEGISVV